MEYTTKTGCNRRNSESRIVKLCLNVMPSRDGGRRIVNPLSLRDLGGGYQLCRNVFIHIEIQSLPQVSDNGTGGRLFAFYITHKLEILTTKNI